MKKLALIAFAALSMSTAFAAKDTQEATPLTDSKAQAHGEEHKKARPAKATKKVNDGSTARGQGSGVADTNKSEARAQMGANAREAKPHKDTTQGTTPK